MSCSEYVATSYRQTPYVSSFPIEVSLNPVELPAVRRPEPKAQKFLMGMVARLDPIKDHATVINAFAEVYKTRPDCELHLAGDGILRATLESQVNDLGISQAVIFHGDVSDVYSHLRQWNLFLYATTMEEGLGSSVAEAMANGLPCVLSDLPMLQELAPGDLATWFEPHNANELAAKIILLLNEHDLRNRMGEQSYRHAQQNFAADRFIASYTHDIKK